MSTEERPPMAVDVGWLRELADDVEVMDDEIVRLRALVAELRRIHSSLDNPQAPEWLSAAEAYRWACGWSACATAVLRRHGFGDR